MEHFTRKCNKSAYFNCFAWYEKKSKSLVTTVHPESTPELLMGNDMVAAIILDATKLWLIFAQFFSSEATL